MTKHFQKKLLLLLVAVILATGGFSCKLFPTKQAPAALTKTIQLNYWGVWDEPAFLAPLIKDFQALHPNIKIKYTRFRFSEYEQKLLEAWAADRGPDIYSLPASWLTKYQSFITPQPAQVQLAFEQITKTLGQEERTTVVRGVPIFSAADIKNKFVDQVYEDVVSNGKIYGLPYSLDSLVLLYNRDLLDKAGIATAPTNWDEVAEAAAKISQIDLNNNPIQSGITLGTADNINNAVDIVSLLMIQNGTIMTDKNGRVAFANKAAGKDSYYPGLAALNFYTDFADPLKQVYSWNAKQANSLDAFVSGKVGMTLGYTYQLREIKGRAPKINLGVAPLPQIINSTKAVNYTNYWAETVSHKTANVDAAWGFINFAASQEQVVKYLAQAKKPSALRALINGQKDDPEIGVFANQTLTAQNWYQGKDQLKMEEIFKDLIKNFATTPNQLKLLQNAADKVNQTL
ncbi:MAG: extracellular solute-binding protein [Candidatus Komeilibacteria bacterium]|nr:extracellular solute-binding protein [Candidatus Komeilibacteria bacterium]